MTIVEDVEAQLFIAVLLSWGQDTPSEHSFFWSRFSKVSQMSNCHKASDNGGTTSAGTFRQISSGQCLGSNAFIKTHEEKL